MFKVGDKVRLVDGTSPYVGAEGIVLSSDNHATTIRVYKSPHYSLIVGSEPWFYTRRFAKISKSGFGQWARNIELKKGDVVGHGVVAEVHKQK